MNKLKKEKVEVTKIGNVSLDKDEIALLSLPPKFAVRKRLDSLTMQTDVEMSMAKVRYQTSKEEGVREIDSEDDKNRDNKRRKKKLSKEEIDEMEMIERLEAEGRRVYDPECKVFDHGNKRATDLAENKKVTLPKPCDNYTESSIEVLRRKIMENFRKYRDNNCNERGEQESNLNKEELRGLRNLKKRIRNCNIKDRQVRKASTDE